MKRSSGLIQLQKVVDIGYVNMHPADMNQSMSASSFEGSTQISNLLKQRVCLKEDVLDGDRKWLR